MQLLSMPKERLTEKTKDGMDQALGIPEHARDFCRCILSQGADALAEEALELDL